MERWLKQLTGLNFYDISAEEEVRRKALTHRRDANKLKSDARIAAKYGQRSEAEDLLEQAKSELEEARIAIQRLNQLRGSRARAINARSTP